MFDHPVQSPAFVTGRHFRADLDDLFLESLSLGCVIGENGEFLGVLLDEVFFHEDAGAGLADALEDAEGLFEEAGVEAGEF